MTYFNKIFFGFVLADNDILAVIDSGQTDVEPTAGLNVRIFGKSADQTSHYYSVDVEARGERSQLALSGIDRY